MNKKIDSLMKQSYYDVDQNNRIFSPEKFAELIIRECAEVAMEHEDRYINTNPIHQKKLKPCLVKLRVLGHFGV